VGASGDERRIVHVAPAVGARDAVNLQQLQALIAAAHAPNLTPMAGGTIVSHRGANANPSRRDGRVASLGELKQETDDAHPGRNGATTALPASSFSCELGSGKAATAAGEQSSVSSAFTPLQHSGISFQQGGLANGCVTVSFSAEVLAPGSGIMEVRAMLDGGIEASPGPLLMAQDDDAFRSRAFDFVFANVAPGAHRVELQIRNAGGSGFVRVGQRTTMVRFAH
jgi:hypothetical protein